MGEREEQDALKAVAGEAQCAKSRETFLDTLLRPFRILKQKFREFQIRRSLRKQFAAADAIKIEYQPVPEDQDVRNIEKDNWLLDVISEEDDTKTKEK